MKPTVIVRSKDEADRLRLVLTSLARQTVKAEVVVVDDGSSDHTPAVIAEAARDLPLVVIRHDIARGRSAASNAGARAACGDVLIFLDGDTLAAPDLAEQHMAVHADANGLIGRGETWNLRCTRFLLDPETGSPRPGEETRIAALPPEELARLRVTRRQVLDDFAAIKARAQEGVYPSAGPRRLYRLEMAALRRHPDCQVLWAASAGSNASISRKRFLDAGGFDERIHNTEHREFAFRACAAGAKMVPVDGASTYHMTHRSGWRDPLIQTDWERIFYDAHPTTAVKLLAVFWASLVPDSDMPPEARITSLPDLEAAARGEKNVDYDAVRCALGLQALGSARREAGPAMASSA